MSTLMQVGFPVDFLILKRRSVSGGPLNTDSGHFVDRLRGNSLILTSTTTNAESTSANPTYVFNSKTADGIDVNLTGSNSAYVGYSFKRAPGFMDVVCYTGNGASYQTLNHNLGVAPQLFICKSRSAASTNWVVTGEGIGLIEVVGFLNSTVAFGGTAYNNGYLSAAGATVGQFYAGFGTTNNNNANASASTYVAYLFATLAGISKVGSYTGNGSSQNIECGFAAGARFVLIKCTSTTGDWYVWDTARGIVVDTEPHLSLNTTAGEQVSPDDSIDPYSPGFAVNQVAATNINVTSATYIFLAIS